MVEELNNLNRSYEVSVWTLQDSFITVLKQFKLGVKGTIQDPKLSLNSDGTQNFSFSIPMKLYIDGEWRDNPIWYNTQNKNLLANMRKIKVIFENDNDSDDVIDDNIFEFIITKMIMQHSQDCPMCEVTCDNGLAYHELGKQGYKLELSSDVFYNNDIAAFTGEDDKVVVDPSSSSDSKIGVGLTANIDYWCQQQLQLEYVPIDEHGKIDIDNMDPRKWYYRVVMDWSSYNGTRASNKIYEDDYVSSWDNNGVAVQTEHYKEKERLVDEKESNLYNLTQSLATAFNVYCRYDYIHDIHRQIIGKVITFYNNFLSEADNGILQLQYPYTTTDVSRDIESTDIVTKMYIDTIYDDSARGAISIMNTEANKMQEDYLFNFDYLHEDDVATITDDQYNAIGEYEVKIRALNEEIIPLQNQISALLQQQIDISAKKKVAENSEGLATERIDDIEALLTSLGSTDGISDKEIVIGPSAPQSTIIKEQTDKNNKKSYYIDINTKGVMNTKEKPITIYTSIPIDANTTKIKGKVIPDDSGNITSMKLSSLPSNVKTGSLVYLTFTYKPSTYYDNIKEMWGRRASKDKKDAEEYSVQLADIEQKIADKQATLDAKLDEKQELIKEFQLMMGPALREGHWTPEDYSNYGDRYTEELTQIGASTNAKYLNPVWDEVLFIDEQHNYYEVSVEQGRVYYPHIKLTSESWIEVLKQIVLGKTISFVFYDYAASEVKEEALKDANCRIITLGGGMQLIFVKDGDDIKPSIIITEAESMSDDEILYMMRTGRLSVISYEVSDPTDILEENNEGQEGESQSEGQEEESENTSSKDFVTIVEEIIVHSYASDENNKIDWYGCDLGQQSYTQNSVTQVYPRIKVNSLDLMTDSNNLALLYNSKSLKNYEDYQVLLRNPVASEENYQQSQETQDDSPYYCITLKANTMLTKGLNYIIDDEGNVTDEPDDQSIDNIISRKINIRYAISNASTAIYLDAIKILKENAFPKVSYSVTPTVLQVEIMNNLYSYLTRIININDNELKLHDAYGYISALELDLDHPWNDTITVQNYKNKFEDIFSTITAQTEAMQRREYGLNETMQVVDFVSGQINEAMLQSTINNGTLNYSFNDDKLVLTEQDGLTGISRDGIISMRNNGIFVANQQDEDGNWLWNTAILPSGINANLIRTGQLDTQKIIIYSGDEVRFQWNQEGIYAYKSILDNNSSNNNDDDSSNNNSVISSSSTSTSLVDNNAYVLFNSEGLGLWRKKQTDWTDQQDQETITTNLIKQVEVSWKGFILRNKDNEEVFYADKDGNLTIKGIIKAQAGGEIAGWDINEKSITSPVANVGDTPLITLQSTTDGTMNPGIYANAGRIGGWAIETNKLYASRDFGDESAHNYRFVALSTNTGNNYCIAAGASNISNLGTAPFSVNFNGEMKATKGEIGGWIIDDTSLYNSGDAINMLLRGKKDASQGDKLGQGNIGIFTRLSSENADFITVNGTTYYLYTLTPSIDDINELYAEGNYQSGKTGVSLYEIKNNTNYTAKYKITKKVDDSEIKYISWVPINSGNDQKSLAPADDPRVMFYYGEDHTKIYPSADRLEQDYQDSTPQQIYNALSQIIQDTDDIKDSTGQEIITTSTHNVNDYITSTTITEMQKKAESSSSLTIKLKTLQPAFSLNGETGRIETNLGRLGSFEFNEEKMKDGKFDKNVKFEITAADGTITSKILDQLGECIVNAWYSGDLNHKKLVLVKLNGKRITIPGKDGQGKEVYISAHR